MTQLITVSVVYALAEKQKNITVSVCEGTTIIQAIELSKISDYFDLPELDQLSVGVFSMPRRLSDVLNDGDRVEIYRPLIADPKEVRRKRAAAAKEKSKDK